MEILIFLVLVGLGISTIGRVWLKWRQLDDSKLYKNPRRLFSTKKQKPILGLLLVGIVIAMLSFKLMLISA